MPEETSNLASINWSSTRVFPVDRRRSRLARCETAAVSLILTWEDPSVDVDLHIREVGGEHVWYRSRESKHGGLLYYDITDGFGPEIYTLGAGPAGAYKLSVVYFRGSTKDVRGTLTVLRNAGSAQETRRDIPFVLAKADRNVELPLGEFELTEADRSVDGSTTK